MDVLLLSASFAVSWMAGRPGDGDDGRSWASRSWGGLAKMLGGFRKGRASRLRPRLRRNHVEVTGFSRNQKMRAKDGAEDRAKDSA
jgi:hypothetical protein